jgi:crotonobetainyl-CoA:carnitine CoA-transferase CaiB-like acyl-CoA transferase
MLNLLTNLKVLDLSQRLPGPLATKELELLGAQVTKASPIGKKDAFELADDLLFNEWFKKLNSNKIIEYFSDENIQELISAHDIIISPSNFDESSFDLENKVLIKVGGSADLSPMHDLNALAKTSNFKLYLNKFTSDQIDPPYLPFAGIIYGQKIAMTALAALYKLASTNKTQIIDLFLDRSTMQTLDLFWSDKLENQKQVKFLHNGALPCYNIYTTSDKKHVALACVEDHFWEKFCDIFDLTLKKEDRFDTTSKTTNLITGVFKKLTLNAIINRVGKEQICLTPIN